MRAHEDDPDLDIEKMMRGMGGSSSDEILVNEFTESSAQEFRDKVLGASKGDPMKPIIVYIDSYGGEVDALAKMIETMDEVANPTITVAIGKSMSCGAILLSHGDIRFCGKHSRIMVHEVSCGSMGDVHDVDSQTQENKRLNKHFMGLLAQNCKISGGYSALRKMIKDQDGRDRYMDAEEALRFGIVDVIGMPRIERVNLYQVSTTPAKNKILKNKPTKRHKGKKTKK